MFVDDAYILIPVKTKEELREVLEWLKGRGYKLKNDIDYMVDTNSWEIKDTYILIEEFTGYNVSLVDKDLAKQWKTKYIILK